MDRLRRKTDGEKPLWQVLVDESDRASHGTGQQTAGNEQCELPAGIDAGEGEPDMAINTTLPDTVIGTDHPAILPDVTASTSTIIRSNVNDNAANSNQSSDLTSASDTSPLTTLSDTSSLTSLEDDQGLAPRRKRIIKSIPARRKGTRLSRRQQARSPSPMEVENTGVDLAAAAGDAQGKVDGLDFKVRSDQCLEQIKVSRPELNAAVENTAPQSDILTEGSSEDVEVAATIVTAAAKDARDKRYRQLLQMGCHEFILALGLLLDLSDQPSESEHEVPVTQSDCDIMPAETSRRSDPGESKHLSLSG